MPPNANLAAINTPDGLTGVFCVDRSGQLLLFTVQGYGLWGGPVAIGSPGTFAPGAAVRASLQAGTGGQVDVFLIDLHGNLVTFWGKLSGGWNGPQARSGGYAAVQMTGPGVATVPDLNQTILVAVDGEADLNAFGVVAAGVWSNAQVPDTTQRGEFGSPPAVTQRYGTKEALALMVDRYQSLVCYTQDALNKWSGPISVHDKISVTGAYVATA